MTVRHLRPRPHQMASYGVLELTFQDRVEPDRQTWQQPAPGVTTTIADPRPFASRLSFTPDLSRDIAGQEGR